MVNIDFSGPEKFHKKATGKALRQYNKYLKWAKNQNKKNWKKNTPIIDNMTAMMNDATTNARAMQDRYNKTFIPYEDQLMNEHIPGYQEKIDAFSSEVAKLKQEAEDYGSEANREFLMGRAQAHVGQAFERARDTNLMKLESMGINPAATRYAAMDNDIRMAEAAAKAAAGTRAGMDVGETSRAMFNEALAVEAKARGLDLEVLGLEKRMVDVGQISQELGLKQQGMAGELGKTAAGAQLSTSELALKHRATSNDFMRSVNESIGAWSDTLDASYQNQIAAEKAEAEASSGIGSAIGALAPIIPKLPIFAQEGGGIPFEASPSGGAIADDVDTMLTAGEFVFPVEISAVLWITETAKNDR